MKKSVLLAVLGVITIGCIFYGTMRHMNSFGRNGLKDFSWNFDFDDDEEVAEGEDDNSLNVPLEDFDSIKIDCQIGHIKIEEGSSFRLESTFNKEYLRPLYSVQNKTLKITQQQRRGPNGNNNCRIHITVPAGVVFDSVDIDSNVGDIYINDLSGKKLDTDLNVGEVRIHDVAFDNIDIDNNVGEISVSLKDNLKDYSMSLSTDVGVVNVDGKTHKRHYSSNGKGSKKLNINTNVGEVNVR